MSPKDTRPSHERVAAHVDTWPSLGASAARRLLLLLGINALRIYILDLYLNMLHIYQYDEFVLFKIPFKIKDL